MSSISVSTNSQLQAIYSMMEQGQNSVKMERHTLLIWGLTAAVLILITDEIFNLDTFPVVWQRVLGQTLFISVILFIAGVWDFKKTRQIRQDRDETLSFIQLQLTQVWWFFIGLIVVLNVGMNFFGGGYMFYGLTLALIGMAFYIHGLFSTQMLKWVGIMLIIIGLGSISLDLHFLALKWLAAGVFGLGFPLLAFALDKPMVHSTRLKRFGLSIVWFSIVLVPSVLAYQFESGFNPAGIAVRSLEQYRALSKEHAAKQQIIHLPAGTEIPVKVNMQTDMVETKESVAMVMKLTRDLDVVIEGGKTNGHFRLGDDKWLNRLSHLRTTKFKLYSQVKQDEGPSVNIDFNLDVR